MSSRVTIVAFGLLVAVACGGSDASPEAEAATADLAATLGVDSGDIEVVVDETVTWSDGSLGCPEPDGLYTQALVPGFRIVLEVDGTQYAYHGAEGTDPVFCESPDPSRVS